MIQVVSNNVSNISSISGVSDGDGVVISIVIVVDPTVIVYNLQYTLVQWQLAVDLPNRVC